MIEEKTRLVQLLDDYIERRRPHDRHRHRAPRRPTCSTSASSTSTYSDGHGTGAVGVIGPTRMRYSRAINAVDSLSHAITRMVNSRVMTPGQTTLHDIDEPTTAEPDTRREPRRTAVADPAARLQRAARRVLRPAAAQDGRVRQLPQAHRPRAPGSCREAAAGEHDRGAPAARRRSRARAEGRRRQRRRRGHTAAASS